MPGPPDFDGVPATAAIYFPMTVANRRIGRGERKSSRVRRIREDVGGLVLMDQEPVRREAAARCTAVMARLERARGQWQQYEREDKPAFIRWRAREFGALLSTAREVELQITAQQALVHEVEMEMRRGFYDPHSAYERVMSRRGDPAAAAPPPPPAEEPARAKARPLTDFEKEALFQEWVQKFLGTNPDKMDDKAYAATFETFKSHMFKTPVEPPRLLPRRPVPRRPEMAEEEETRAGVADSPDTRVKELYRRLVRRLHPDLRADGDAAVSSLWHEVQEAYVASDVARMELLLALSDIAADHMDARTSVSQMQALEGTLARAVRALEKSVLEAQDEEAWNFARSGPDEELRAQVQRRLEHDLRLRRQRLDLLTRTIAGWARSPVLPRAPA